jgi:hypothetical protein
MEQVRLYDFGASAKVPTSKMSITMVTPNNDDSFNIDLNLNKSVVAVKGSMTRRRKVLSHLALGADYYLSIDDSEKKLQDDLRSWATDFVKSESGYQIKNKNYFILREPSIDDINNMSREDIKTLNQIIADSDLIYTTDDPLTISYEEPDHSHEGYLLDRSVVEKLFNGSLEKMRFKDYIDVYEQHGKDFSKIEIEDVLDTPKTFVPNTKSTPKVETKQMHLFYEYDASEPLYMLPDCLKHCPVVEFTFDHFTDEGKLVWRKNDKIIQNEYPEEYDNSLREKGNRSFLSIEGPDVDEIIDELGNTGVLQEFELCDPPKDAGKSFINAKYYISNQYFASKDNSKEIK